MTTVALILAAGEGTRMKSKTPKVLHKVLGTSMVELVIRAAEDAGCTHTIVVTGHEAETVNAALPSGVHTVFQAERIGTANAVEVAKSKIEELLGRSLEHEDGTSPDRGMLVVLSGDTPLVQASTIKSLIDHTRKSGAAATILTAQEKDPFGYGRIIRDEKGAFARIVEEKDATKEEREVSETNTGTYCFALDNLFERLLKISNDNAQGEYYLPDVFQILLGEGLVVETLLADTPEEVAGVNSREQLAIAAQNMQTRINSAHMAAGVGIADPRVTWISPRAVIEQDVTILPNTHICGRSVIKSGAVVGPDSRIVDSIIGENAVVDSSIILESEIKRAATVGPRSYLRPNCVVGEEAKVGTSVEVKASIIGDRSKVPHLSYIGDAIIGVDSNIGAGTITCNYDGKNKSKTVIGDNVFIGSDTMLIAPVTIEDGAMIGASSAITNNVPKDALALERSEQRIYENRAKERRAQWEEGATGACKS